MSGEPTGIDLQAVRRRFLANCGKFAVATPPAVSLLLAASHSHYAAASSGYVVLGSGLAVGSANDKPQVNYSQDSTPGSSLLNGGNIITNSYASDTSNPPNVVIGGIAGVP